ncbi:MAG: CoA pyrophosphatase [Desulfuromonadales bacterium]|nr:CoA pyrophosphatase [Desulfuromonadales bacterium]
MSPFDEISQYLAIHPARSLEAQQLRPAAVLVPLFQRHDETWVLLTRRTEHLPKHAGEISFPGGGAEPGDADLWQTALRETEEEMGIVAADVTCLGQLDDIASVHGYLVTPYVGSFTHPYPYRIDYGEIDEVIELPLQSLCDPQVYHQEDWQHKGRVVPVDFYRLDGHEIWGLTAAILRQLLSRLDPFFAADDRASRGGR